MKDYRTARQALRQGTRETTKKTWMDIIRQDLKSMDSSWNDDKKPATDTATWRQRVVQCRYQYPGCTNVYSIRVLIKMSSISIHSKPNGRLLT